MLVYATKVCGYVCLMSVRSSLLTRLRSKIKTIQLLGKSLKTEKKQYASVCNKGMFDVCMPWSSLDKAAVWCS